MTEIKKCLTPNTYYQHGILQQHILQVRLVFPFQMFYWIDGSSAITATGDSDAKRLLAYEQRNEERKRITNLIHDAMEPVGADCYRVMREIDQRLGTDKVERGIQKSYRPMPFKY